MRLNQVTVTMADLDAGCMCTLRLARVTNIFSQMQQQVRSSKVAPQ
ncbi:hypothetical protein FHT91_006324 [Rhizobium sp. BK347]|nr:hypothetical protein [Rhizobium sp. BK252]MBB3406036.1 hypothetical protein [Rhizobium sp. BK289]MBB3416564.1 hypothetical protein [Rhizobium sp. BK284]MBB3486500.1 hypothetical protein [Rhizobium sp. BK347]